MSVSITARRTNPIHSFPLQHTQEKREGGRATSGYGRPIKEEEQLNMLVGEGEQKPIGRVAYARWIRCGFE